MAPPPPKSAKSAKLALRRAFSRVVSSPRTEQVRFALAGVQRRIRRAGRKATFFHCVDDPMSLLVALSLHEWFPDDEVELAVKIVSKRPSEFFPDPDLFIEASLRDAPELAQLFDLSFPSDPQRVSPDWADKVRRFLISRQDSIEILEELCELGTLLFAGDTAGVEKRLATFKSPPPGVIAAIAEKNERDLARANHFASGLVCFEGGYYLGVDRLERLRERLGIELARDVGTAGPPVPAETLEGPEGAGADGPELEFFFSFRSPYSYLAYDRMLRLCDHYGVQCNLRPVLPIRMRGVPVPQKKALQFVLDCAAEARALGIPFGDIADPLGAGVERTYAVWPYAKKLGLEREWFRAAFVAAWSEGVDLATDAGLHAVAERVGIDADTVEKALKDEGWRALVDANMDAQKAAGFWGVPCFVYGDTKSWGQDRLVLVERAILRRAGETSRPSKTA